MAERNSQPPHNWEVLQAQPRQFPPDVNDSLSPRNSYRLLNASSIACEGYEHRLVYGRTHASLQMCMTCAINKHDVAEKMLSEIMRCSMVCAHSEWDRWWSFKLELNRLGFHPQCGRLAPWPMNHHQPCWLVGYHWFVSEDRNCLNGYHHVSL